MNELREQYYRLFIHESAQKFTVAKLDNKEVNYPHQMNYDTEGNPLNYKYLTESDLMASIKGDKSLGLILCQDKTGLTRCGAIDIDTPRDGKDLKEALTIAQNIVKTGKELGVNLYIEFSGNRGFHIWVFVEKAITPKPITELLRAIALRANFNPQEIYPKDVNSNIKLPCTIHLKTGKRCGFISPNFDVNNPEIDLEAQSELMAKLEPLGIDKLINLNSELMADRRYGDNSDNKSSNNSHSNHLDSSEDKPINSDKLPSRSKEEMKKLLESLGDHPSCIKHLLANGAPLEIDYNQVNLTLSRYCLTKGLTLNDSLPLAELMAKNTSEAHSTSKDYRGKVENFKSAFNSCDRNSDNYIFECSYILSGIKDKPISERGCIGVKCPIHNNHNPNYKSDIKDKSDYSNNSDNSTNPINSETSKADTTPKLLINALIFEALVNLTNEGKEIVKSQILRECEKLQSNYLTGNNDISDSIRLSESEVIAYLLQYPEEIINYSDIFPQGFIGMGDNDSLSQYLDTLLTLPLPSQSTIEEYLEEIREKGIRAIALSKINSFSNQIKISNSMSDSLNNLSEEIEELTRLSIGNSNLLPVSEVSINWLEDLFCEDIVNIPTFSQDLNYLLNGGLAKGRLYVLGAPPANGKSTISAQIADSAVFKGFRVGYASYEMSADQLFLSALSRYGKINSSLIEGKKHFKDKQLATKLIEVYEDYNERIAEKLFYLECDDFHTPNKLLAIIKKLNLDLLIVDYLQLLNTGDNDLDTGNNETVKISKIATELKRIARKTQIPIIAISDINKNAYKEAMKGGDLDLSALRDSFKIAHSADTVMFLVSNNVSIFVKDDEKNKGEKSVTQLYILSEKVRDYSLELSSKIIELAHKFKLDKNTSDTYSRLIIAKNRGGKCGDILFRYSKALHYFEPLNFLTSNFNFNEEF